MYDNTNVFYKIIHGLITTQPVTSSPKSILLSDIQPRAKIHYLLIPKGNYKDWNEFLLHGSREEHRDYLDHLYQTIKNLPNYKLVINVGKGGSQEILHLHTHILSYDTLPSDIVPLEHLVAPKTFGTFVMGQYLDNINNLHPKPRSIKDPNIEFWTHKLRSHYILMCNSSIEKILTDNNLWLQLREIFIQHIIPCFPNGYRIILNHSEKMILHICSLV